MTRSRIALAAALGAALLAILLLLHRHGVQLQDVTPARFRDILLASHGWAPVLYLVVCGQPVVPVPVTILIMAAGLAFGPLWGAVLSIAGSMLRALAQYGVARLLGRQTIQRLLRGRLARLDQLASQYGFRTALAFRLLPMGAPFDLQNIVLGLSPVSLRAYAAATFLGLLPVTIVFVLVGHSMTDWRQGWRILLAIVGVGLLIGAQRWLASRRRAPSTPPAP